MARKKSDALQFDLGLESGGLAGEDGAVREGTPGVLPEEPQFAPPAGSRDDGRHGLRLAREALVAAEEEVVPPPPPPPGQAPERALSVAGFYDRLRRALRAGFPDEVWVTGEIRKVTISKQHRFIELSDHADPSRDDDSPYAARAAAPTLEVACWSREWPRIAARLEAVGIELTDGLVVRVRGKVSVWDAGARVRFSLSDIDVEALVGGIAAARRRLLATLEAEGVLEANRSLPPPLVPLRVGLVTSEGSDAYHDFTGQLERSGLAFTVRLERSLVQGPQAPGQLAAALRRLQRVDVDLIVVVRGGGAKGDLAAFDHEAVARGIVSSRVPVWTGIGHTGDRSVADEIAQRALVTPTACGEAVVAAVSGFLTSLASRARSVAEAGARAVTLAESELGRQRSDLARASRHEVVIAEQSLRSSRAALERAATLTLSRCRGGLGRRAARLASLGVRRLETAEQLLVAAHDGLEARNPRRLLERGWSLTRRSDGTVVKSVSGLAAGEVLRTTVADGTVSSSVESVDAWSVRSGAP